MVCSYFLIEKLTVLLQAISLKLFYYEFHLKYGIVTLSNLRNVKTFPQSNLKRSFNNLEISTFLN